jgi:hypothetical protein
MEERGMAEIDGVWETEAKSPMGVEKATLTLETGPGGTLTGKSVSAKDGSVLELTDGRYEGDKAFYTMQVTKPMKIKLKIEVTVTGDTMEGFASAGFLGKAELKGTRQA